MNFKPNLWKILVSIAIGGVISLWNYSVHVFGDPLPSLGTSVLVALISAVIVYVIWSLVRKGGK